jgi:hypothetical protein
MWATIRSKAKFDIRVSAQPPRGSGKLTRAYDLTLTVLFGGRVMVHETSRSQLLPISCAQRHINDDGSFCLGLRADVSVNDNAGAEIWWERLKIFLTCQETAAQSGKWPPILQVSHGGAADIQLEAEELAKKLGQARAYEDAVAYDDGPIAELSKQVSRVTGRLPKQRMPCDCGYTENGRVKRRQQCARDNNRCLPVLENRRRKAEAAFWRDRKGKVSCCGTIDNCPLNK